MQRTRGLCAVFMAAEWAHSGARFRLGWKRVRAADACSLGGFVEPLAMRPASLTRCSERWRAVIRLLSKPFSETPTAGAGPERGATPLNVRNGRSFGRSKFWVSIQL